MNTSLPIYKLGLPDPMFTFDVDTFPADNMSKLEYVVAVADRIAPDIAHTADGELFMEGYSQAPFIFARRYNAGTLDVDFNYGNYMRTVRGKESIQDIITALGIDSEKLWYLLLFVTDYVKGYTKYGQQINQTPAEEIERLVRMIEEGGVDRKSEISLTLKIKGQRSFRIINPPTLSVIAWACRRSVREISPNSSIYSSTLGEKISTSMTVSVWIFAKVMLKFFELYPEFTARRGSTNGVRLGKYNFISRLAYFCGITDSEVYDGNDMWDLGDTLKSVLKQYKNTKLEIMNSIYGGSF